jgi:hypothetical protein
MPILPSRPSWLLQYLASSQIRCPGNVKAIRSPCSKSRIVHGGGKRHYGIAPKCNRLADRYLAPQLLAFVSLAPVLSQAVAMSRTKLIGR